MVRQRRGRSHQTRRPSGAKLANGQGSVYKKGDKFICAVSLGPKKRKAWTFDTWEEAEAARIEALRLKEEGTLLNTGRQTTGAFLDEWIKVEALSGDLTDRTVRNYEWRISLAKRYINQVQLDKLTPRHLRSLYASLLSDGIATTSVATVHGLLHQILKDATRWELIPSNPAEKVDAPRKKHREIPTLTGEEVAKLLESTKGQRLHALWMVLVMTGVRQGEALGLRWADIAPDFSTVRITVQMQMVRGKGLILCPLKTEKSRRELVLLPMVEDALRAHQSRQIEERLSRPLTWTNMDLVFCNMTGGPMTSGHLNRNFKWALKGAGLDPIRPHALRHTFITALLNEQGVPLPIVSELAGHATPAVTMNTYAHVRPVMKVEAIKRMANFIGKESDGE